LSKANASQRRSHLLFLRQSTSRTTGPTPSETRCLHRQTQHIRRTLSTRTFFKTAWRAASSEQRPLGTVGLCVLHHFRARQPGTIFGERIMAGVGVLFLGASAVRLFR
ncbi:hypothetical protein OF83DRAFT_768444, partial [Amylostereum chailletii]